VLHKCCTCRAHVPELMSSITDKIKYQVSSDNFLVVDIGTQNMKVIEVKRKGQTFQIKKAFTISEMSKFFTGPDMFNVNGIVESLSQILQLERIKTKNILLSFSAGKLQSKIISVPELPDKELRTFVELEYPKQLQNYNKMTDVVDYMPLGIFTKPNSNQKQLSVLLASYPIIDAERIIKEFQKKKYKVNVIEVDVAALGNIGRIYNESDSEDIVVLHVGHNISQMVFLKADAVVFSRTVAFGMGNLIKSIQNQEDISFAQAESIVKEVGLHATEDVQSDNFTIFADDYNDIVEQYLTNTLNDVYRSFQSVNSNYGLSISSVLLTGGFSSVSGSQEISQRILEMSVEEFYIENGEKIRLENGITIVNDTEKIIDGVYAICLGTAIRDAF